LQVTGSPTKQ